LAVRAETKLEVRPPQKLPSSNPVLKMGGEPELVFMGGEYCPYCATERWPLVMALAKFGTFSHLSGTTSSATDVYPSTPSFSFYGSSFSSAVIEFQGDEMYTNHGQDSATGVFPVLQAPTLQEQDLMSKYDAPPYTPSSEAGGIPFIYLAGRFLLIGPQFVTSALTRRQWATAATTVTSGQGTTSRQVEASAGLLVGDICAITHGQPVSVCSQVPPALFGISTSSTR
jgi:hypothetical protein